MGGVLGVSGRVQEDPQPVELLAGCFGTDGGVVEDQGVAVPCGGPVGAGVEEDAVPQAEVGRGLDAVGEVAFAGIETETVGGEPVREGEARQEVWEVCAGGEAEGVEEEVGEAVGGVRRGKGGGAGLAGIVGVGPFGVT